MLIVDAQVHLWSGGTVMPGHRQQPFGKDELLKEMAGAGVDKAVIVPPSWDPNGNAQAIEAVRAHPERFRIMGRLHLERPESRALVDGWNRQPGMLGLRFVFNTPERQAWLSDGTADWVWGAAERAGLPVMIFTPGLLPRVVAIAERHPGLRLVIDHMGIRSGTKDAAAFAELPQLLALARFLNVAVKASGAPTYSSETYPYRNIHGWLRQIYDAFGPARMFWGTDLTRLNCTYRQSVTLFTEELPFLSAADKEKVMGRALGAWIGWELPA